MKKIIKKILIIFTSVLLVGILVVGSIAFKIFIIGDAWNPDSIRITEIYVRGSQIQFSGDLGTSSANVYKDHKYRTDGNDMYIKIYSTVVSSFYTSDKFDISIYDDFTGVTAIYLEDNKGNIKLIWEK